ncbi:hypothetical protein J3R82DRAFT_1818 [Butyriboletus roseoflavus]|nr:hypothetical protein J3R82DRAFT_1818 [Butyriboletus roseoflavus]
MAVGERDVILNELIQDHSKRGDQSSCYRSHKIAGPTTEVTVKHLNIRLKTDAFNVFHDELSAWLSPNKSRILRQILLRLYDLGSLVGVIGILFGFCLLFLTAASLSSEILRMQRDGYQGASTLTKRGLEHTGDTTPSIAPASNALRINPIVSIPLRV